MDVDSNPWRPGDGGSNHVQQGGRAGLYRVARGEVRVQRSPREPTALQWACVRNWSLGNARGRGLLICNLKRASAKLQQYLVQRRYTHAPPYDRTPPGLRLYPLVPSSPLGS